MRYILILLTILIVATGCLSKPYEFDENKAYEMLKVQSDWLHRYPGGKDASSCRNYLKESLEPYCHKYIEQDFSLNIKGKDLDLKNIIGIINPKAKEFVILASHYDNRPFSDKEWEKSKINKPCPGANDGASSTALLLELAKVLYSEKLNVGVIIVLFDGEDYGHEEKNMYLGSKYFANHISDIVSKNTIKYGILLDMIGDKNLNINIESISNYTSPDLVEDIWNTAKELGYNEFIPKTRYAISDDHISLIEVGIDCIDIIDFDYKYWHKNEDTADKCSPKSLKIVADTLNEFLKKVQ